MFYKKKKKYCRDDLTYNTTFKAVTQVFQHSLLQYTDSLINIPQ